MPISQILADKAQPRVVTVTPETSVKAAVETMVDNHVGCVVVMENGAPVGILSERDVLRLYRAHGAALEKLRTAEVMTRDLMVGHPGSAVDEVMTLMTSRRFRHLPVMDGDRLVGIVSLGDLVKHQLLATEVEAEALKRYIYAS